MEFHDDSWALALEVFWLDFLAVAPFVTVSQPDNLK